MTDVLVIGGGIVGCAVAAHLAEAGRTVVLVEGRAIAAGASGRNSGVVQHPLDPVLVGLHLETVALYRALGSSGPHGDLLPSAPAGLLSVTLDPAVARSEAEHLTALYPGLRPTYLAPGEVASMEPVLGPDVAACRLDIGYPVAPTAATEAYAAWAATLGVEIRIGHEARPWMEHDRVRGALLADGSRIEADDVVVAAGPWSPDLVDPSGAWRPIRALWGVVVAIDLGREPTHVIEEAGTDIEPEATDDPGTHSFSLITAAGTSSLGSTFLAAEPDPADELPRILERARAYLPGLDDGRLGALRACARPLSADGRPLVGRVPGMDGLWIAAGHGPWGISTGPAAGPLLVRAMDGDATAIPATLDPARFGSLPDRA